MKLVYLLSIIYLMASFLLYRKKDEKISIVTSVVYTLALLFCYNIVIVSLYSFLKISGSFLVLSLFNLGIGAILNLISYKRGKYQEYVFDKKELLAVLAVVAIVLLIGMWRFRGFTVVSYETGDPAIHYRHAVHFAREFEILTKTNSKDLVYKDFACVMPISYVNCGILMRLFSNVSSVKVFIMFDTLCLGVSSLLFFVTIFNFFKKKKYLYSLILTFIYLLGFPLNTLIFGFVYMGLGVMVINLLFLTISKIKDFNSDLLFKLIILFMISFSIFFSYFLYVPCIYLALGLYYIYLWLKKEITFKKLLLYGTITLILPFIMGMIKLVLPGFLEKESMNVFTAVSLEGYIYSNKDPVYVFLILLAIFNFRDLFKRNREWVYFKFNFVILYLYILLFFLLYVLDFSGQYYFYKLFYLFWLLAIPYIGTLLEHKQKYVYIAFAVIIFSMELVLIFPDSKLAVFLEDSNVFSWNSAKFKENRIIFNKNELEILNETVNYEETCKVDREFLISGDRLKNGWYYSFSGNIPVYGYVYDGTSHLEDPNISFNFWKSLDNYDCLIYFYEDITVDYDKDAEDITVNYDKDAYEVLYENESGAILKKLD